MLEHIAPLVTFECRFKFYPNVVESDFFQTWEGRRAVYGRGDFQENLELGLQYTLSSRETFSSQSNVINKLVDFGINQPLIKSHVNKFDSGEVGTVRHIINRQDMGSESYKEEDLV